MNSFIAPLLTALTVAFLSSGFLSNGTICAIISDVNHESEFSSKGGALIDLGYCGRDDDHYTFNQDLLDGQRTRPLKTHSITSSLNQNTASVTVYATEKGIEQITRYYVNKETPTQLHIDKTLTRLNDIDNEFNVYSSVNFNYHSLEPFVFNSKNIKQSNGFAHEDFVTRGTSALRDAARNADTIISLSPSDAQTPIAYGWHVESATRTNTKETEAIPRFALADDASNAFLFIPDTFYIGDGSEIGLLQLGQIPLLELEEKHSINIKETIYVGRTGDVASITDQFFEKQKHATLSGKVSERDSAIHIDLADGTPVTHIRPQKDGTFSAKLPLGQYSLRHVGSASRVKSTSVSLSTPTHDIGVLELPKVSTVTLPKGHAMRLVVKGINGTQDPNFIDSFTQLSVIDDDGKRFLKANSQVFLAGVAGDKEIIQLADGHYRVYATRGPEYSLETTDLHIQNSKDQILNINIPRHLLPTPNYIASDLHVHSGISFDNTLAEQKRVRTFVAEHGEVMVSSEHDIPVDFKPLINAMGVNNKITSIAAVEITSLLPTERLPFTGGHTNVFPYTPKEHEFRRGVVSNEDRRLREIIHDVRRVEPDALIQLNHPRIDLQLSSDLPKDYLDIIDYGHYLDHMGSAGHPYNPEKPLHSHPNNTLTEKDPKTGFRDIDFDLIELINPGGPEHEDRIIAIRKDWLSFLKQGETIVATANSDSHSSHNQVAVPRTMVAMQNDTVTAFDQASFIRTLKSGNAYGTTGPMIEIDLSGTPMGATFMGNKAILNLSISSVDWINVSHALIQVNGETVKEINLNKAAENGVVNYQLSTPISFKKDAFVTAEVKGKASPDYQIIYPEISPYAFSNAIYVDHNSDGQWQAPGL